MNMSAEEPAVIEPDRIRRITRDEYRTMARAGLFDHERVELLYGQLVVMPPTDPSHEESTNVLGELLKERLGGRARIRLQSSFAASDESEPVPDVKVVRNEAYWHEHPSHAFLVIEVSRTSLRHD